MPPHYPSAPPDFQGQRATVDFIRKPYTELFYLPPMKSPRYLLHNYLSRKTAHAEQLRALIQVLGNDLSDWENLLRQGPILQPENIVPGQLQPERKLTCRQVDYETEYMLYVPSHYDPAGDWPLLLVGHGGNGNMPLKHARMAAFGGIEDWLPIAEKRGWIVAAPLTRRGWGVIGYGVLFSLLFQLKRQLKIDPDRIWLTGHSMGGHLSWRSALHLGDRWAAISPMSGGYDYAARGTMPLLKLVPGYATFGQREPYGIAEANRSMQAWLHQHPDYDWQIMEKAGGHEIFRDELPAIADFFESRRRNLYRQELVAMGLGRDRWDKPNPPWDQQYQWDPQQAIWRSYFHWLQLFDHPDLPKGQWQKVKVRLIPALNRIDLELKDCQRLRLFLHPRMLDLAQPISLYINQKPWFEGEVSFRWDLMVENYPQTR